MQEVLATAKKRQEKENIYKSEGKKKNYLQMTRLSI